uniref:Tc3 transposase DNA binding domain-containing protein n=1 Tax=Cyprinus carpio carpio TaxID=630221 RepID=A0A9J7ZE42_CYPCA
MRKKGDLSDFERGMVVGARRAGLSISKTAELLGFSRTTISRVNREWSKKEKISSDERQLCGQKCLDDVRDDRKATVPQITTRYKQGMQNIISECTTRRHPEADGLQQQKTTLEATICKGSPKLDNRRLEKRCLV